MPKLLGFQKSVPSSWTAGLPAGSIGRPLSHPTPYRDAAAMPGTYYTPGAHPYTTRLPNGIEVMEAYPGQYYVPHPGMGALGLPLLPYSPILCAVVGGVAGGGAGYGAMKMAKKSPMAGAIGGTLVGAIVGYFLCGKPPAPAQEVPPNFQEEEELPPRFEAEEQAAPPTDQGPFVPVITFRPSQPPSLYETLK